MKKILILCLPFILSGCWVIAAGEKVGIIVKLADEGYFLKTHEGQLIRGGMNNGSGSFGDPFDFTIENSDVCTIEKCTMEKFQKIKIHYHLVACAL